LKGRGGPLGWGGGGGGKPIETYPWDKKRKKEGGAGMGYLDDVEKRKEDRLYARLGGGKKQEEDLPLDRLDRDDHNL